GQCREGPLGTVVHEPAPALKSLRTCECFQYNVPGSCHECGGGHRVKSGMNALDLSGRVALVTGGGVGIGRAICLALAAAGARIGIHFHSSREEADETLSLLRQRGGEAFLLPADLTVEAEARGVVQRLTREAKRLDILVNNAGSPLRMCRLEECSTELWQQAFTLNVTSAFWVIQEAIPFLRASGNGAIVNNLSLSV